MLEDVISRLSKALELSPIKTHGSNLQARKVQIKEISKIRRRIRSCAIS